MSSSLQDLPLSAEELEQYRFQKQKRGRSSLVGGHTSRRKGQSLEFREFTPYQIGDDIRHIDWRASARYGRQDDWLVRRFVAEEQFRLVISVDERPTMRLPEKPQDKWQIGLWLAEAIAFIALQADNEVVLHHLFGQKSNEPDILKGKRALKRLRSSLERFQADNTQGNSLNLEAIQRLLKPTSVWIIITDLYFDEEVAQKLAERIVSAQNGFRWVMLLELDSWPYEKALLSPGPYQIEGPGAPDKTRVEISNNSLKDSLKDIECNIEEHRNKFLQDSRLDEKNNVSRFLWETEKGFDPAKFFRDRFREHFEEAQALRNLFRKG